MKELKYGDILYDKVNNDIVIFLREYVETQRKVNGLIACEIETKIGNFLSQTVWLKDNCIKLGNVNDE